MNLNIKRFFRFILCVLVIFSIFFFISLPQSYTPKNLPFIGSVAEPFWLEGISIQAKGYSAQESKNYLNYNLPCKGYQPVQITIQNNTAESFILKEEGLEIGTASANTVALQITSEAIPRSIAYKIAAFIFWPFLLPATIDTICTFNAHLKMKKDFHAKSVKEQGEVILPYSTVNRILFIPSKNYTEEFTLHLQGEKGWFPFSVKIYS